MSVTCLTNKLGIGFLPTFGSCAAVFIVRRYLVSPSHPVKLELIGHLQNASESSYEPGQVFLHKKFGYRGIVLQSWKGKLFEHNLQSTKAVKLALHESPKKKESEINVYQVLTDQNDIEICRSALKPGITLLHDDKRGFNSVYIVPEMDYVFHDDIIPYVPQDSSPIKNRYFSEFLFYTPEKDPSYIPTDHLRRWIEARKHGLEVTSVHREVTEGIQTTVMPFYMGRQVAEDKNKNDLRYWRYLIRLENLVMDRVQLLERFLKFFLIPGKLKSTGGKGVVGTQPVLSPECPVFQYHSHTHFPEEWAYMWGTFRFERNSGASLDVKIPALPLCDPTYFSDSNKK